MTNPGLQPTIITFYSYKGGTGRSMTLANVAWILAANRKRVAVIDWDLEAPGLHRYLHPYLPDPDLLESTGVIDFVMTYAREAIKPATDATDPSWYLRYANLLRHASSLRYDFPKPGTIDFVPSGRQGPDYAARVNSFNWSAFYEKQQGGLFLEAAKQSLSQYDYVLIDSRTGVSDTSGICTVQMPHILVVCFTPNTQSIEGASAIARSADLQRTRSDGTRTLKIFPVMTRVLTAEKERVEAVRRVARARFDELLWHLETPLEKDRYWGRVSIPQHPFYAFEEVLSVFGDQPGQTNTMLASLEMLAGYLTQTEPITDADLPPLQLPQLEDVRRRAELAKFVKFQSPIVQPPPPAAAMPKLPPVTRAARNVVVPGGPSYLFYLSYAAPDGNQYLDEFYRDLVQEVRSLTAANPDEIGFYAPERRIGGGDFSADMVGRALSSARTLVPMMSPSLMSSEHCGKEWQLFENRARQLPRKQPTILPVRWVPLRGALPDRVSRYQLFGASDPLGDRAGGLLHLMRLRRYRDAYREFVYAFSRQLVESAQSEILPPAREFSFETVANAFASGDTEPSRPIGTNAVDIVVLTGTAEEMPSVRRDVSSYAHGTWNPYKSGVPPEIAARNAAVARQLVPSVIARVDLQRLLDASQATVILVDPWALKLDRIGKQVEELDQYVPSGWAFIVVYDETDESQERQAELQRAVSVRLGRVWQLARNLSVVHSERDLADALTSTMALLQLELISRASARLPNQATLPKLS
jgi:FxsC-like protein